MPLDCSHFPLNPRFTERFWHLSKYFFALADRPNHYMNTFFFTRDTAPNKIYAKHDPFYLQFGFLHPTQMDVNNTTHKVNRVKILHTMHNYLFLQHLFQDTNQIIHMNSRVQYANTKLTSPYYMNYSYIIQPKYCEGTLRNFDPIKNYFIFSPLYAKTNRPILVPIEYLQCVEGGAMKSAYAHTFNLLYRGIGWPISSTIGSLHKMKHKSSITFLRYNHNVAVICILVPLLPVWHVIRNSSPSSVIQTIELRTSSSNTGRRPQNYSNTLGLQNHKMRLTLLKKLT